MCVIKTKFHNVSLFCPQEGDFFTLGSILDNMFFRAFHKLYAGATFGFVFAAFWLYYVAVSYM